MLDIEKLMREGKSLDEIGKMVTDEMNAVQKKIEAEKEAARIAAEKKAKAEAEAKKATKRKTDAREAAVAALADYFTLVLPYGKEVDMKAVVNETLDSLEETIKLMSNVTVKYNGKTFSIFDL
jgi:regulator of protease activity HflC (stomatin/prohibitin superfamily)